MTSHHKFILAFVGIIAAGVAIASLALSGHEDHAVGLASVMGTTVFMVALLRYLFGD